MWGLRPWNVWSQTRVTGTKTDDEEAEETETEQSKLITLVSDRTWLLIVTMTGMRKSADQASQSRGSDRELKARRFGDTQHIRTSTSPTLSLGPGTPGLRAQDWETFVFHELRPRPNNYLDIEI